MRAASLRFSCAFVVLILSYIVYLNYIVSIASHLSSYLSPVSYFE